MNDSYGEVIAPDTVRLERHLPGSIERVWEYLTDSELRGKWLATGAMVLQEGGALELTFMHADLSAEKVPPEAYKDYDCAITFQGKVLACEAPRLLAFSWGDGSEVRFELSQADDRVRLVVEHTRLAGTGPMISVSSGWHAHLGVLEDVLEGATPRPFWTTMLQLEGDYRKRISANGTSQ